MPQSLPVDHRFQVMINTLAWIVCMDVVSKSTQIHRTASHSWNSHIEVASSQRVIRQKKTMDDARFSRTVRPEDQRQRLNRNPLRFGERLEVRELQFR